MGDTRAPGGDSLLHVYSHRDKAWSPVRPKDAFTRRGFLDLKDKQGNPSRILDKWVKKRESAAARLFQPDAFVAQGRIPTVAERAELAAFVAHLEIRCPAMHEAFERRLQAAIKLTADFSRVRFANDPEGWAAHIREFEAATGQSAAGIDLHDLDPENLDVTINRTWMLAEFAKAFEPLAKGHAIAHWRFLVAGDQDDFITCDSPVRRRTHFTRTGLGFTIAQLRDSDLLAFTPLTRKIVLAEVPLDQPACAWVSAPASLVTAINQELFVNGSEFVFAGRLQFTGHEFLSGPERDNSQAGAAGLP